MTDLSPTALAVMTAGTMGNPNVINDPVYRQCIAAALRAAADQVAPKPPDSQPGDPLMLIGRWSERRSIHFDLLFIADELETL